MIKLNTIYCEDCTELLRRIDNCVVDAIVTDPPSGIAFMGKSWDNFGGLQAFQDYIYQVFSELIRVLKPGGHAFVWALPRTSHHTAMGIERAGFEIRECVYHIFGSGFPKSLNIGKAVDKLQGNEREDLGEHPNARETVGNINICKKNGSGRLTKGTSEWEGCGTALKPAVECWWLARKPISEKTVAENCLKWGVGGLDIDGCRVGNEKWVRKATGNSTPYGSETTWNDSGTPDIDRTATGRWPSNLILDGSEQVESCFPETKTGGSPATDKNRGKYGKNGMFAQGDKNISYANFANDSGSASRFFQHCSLSPDEVKSIYYCAKASKTERNEGCVDNFWLYELELITDYCNFTAENLFIKTVKQWEKQGQSQSTDSNGEAQQEKDILGVMIAEVGDNEWNTISYGKNITEIFPKAIKYTTSTGTKQTIELKTSNYYQHLSIRDCMEDVIKTAMESGISVAENVGLKNILKLIFIKDQMGFPLGVKIVAKETQQKISVKDVLKLSNTHNTVKPLSLIEYLIKLISREGQTVLDPFAGSGTTGVACINLKRDFILIEREPEYVEIGNSRLEAARRGELKSMRFEEDFAPNQLSLF